MTIMISNSISIKCVHFNNKLHSNYGISAKGNLYCKDRYGFWAKVILQRQNNKSVTNTVVRFNGTNAILSTLIAETLEVSDVEARGIIEQLNIAPLADTYKEVK